MKLSFTIEYRTNWGEIVALSGINGASIPMHTTDGIYWNAEIDLHVPKTGTEIHYNYQIEQDGRVTRKEWNQYPRTLHLSGSNEKKYILQDNWRNQPDDMHLYSSAFTDVLLAHPHKDLPSKHTYRKGLVFKVHAPRIHADYCLAISGNQKALGNWDPQQAWVMSDAHFPEWEMEMDAEKLKFPLEYKFILRSKKDPTIVYWENNPNRYLADPDLRANENLVISDRYVHFDLPTWKGAGVAIPVFSLRSEKSFGVGDFGDLMSLVDWAVCTHQKVIQILPINDTTMTHAWTDSYPYNSISIYAFHPMYLDIRQMGKLKNEEIQQTFNERRKALNALPSIDYEAVNKAKWEYFEQIFAQEGGKVLNSKEFQTFFQANKYWLQPYAAFSYLRDRYQTPNFREWPTHAVYQAEEIDRLCRPHTEEYPKIAIHYFLQFHLHVQLLKATQYARAHGVVLKGDIPIGISRNSVEAWTEPHYFNLNGQAGAPPDDFSVNGQNWGFPTYNWDVMKEDGYQWWMRRFCKMAEYFDAYRIDHILGFFRIWEIPMHAVHGLLGQFVPSLPLTVEEIESYGLPWKEEYLEPAIEESALLQLFGPYAETVKHTFIEPSEQVGWYRMREAFKTQRQVKDYFDQQPEANEWIREGLYTLISNVLFVPDRKVPNLYHPRISVQRDFVFRTLTTEEQAAFNRLYDQYYYHRHNDFWRAQAMEKLPQLTQATRMLVCGEDLGMIPACVASVMEELRILSLEIERMPKNPWNEFGLLKEYPYRSVSTISTHDMSPLREWWEEDAQQTQRYYNQSLGHYGLAPTQATAALCEEVVRNHLAGNSLLCILSFQDWLSIDEKYRHPDALAERINVPANPRHYWRYRMHLTLEQLMKANELNEKIRQLIDRNGRNLHS